MKKQWQLIPDPPKSFYEEHPELPDIVATLLFHRGIQTQKAIDEFLHPEYGEDIHDPYLFQDMQKAVDRLFVAMEKKEQITIHGDYDADGVSASVILANLFHALEYPHVNVFLPHRETDGYGLNKYTVQSLAAQGTRIIITCDCGISNREEVMLANKKDIDVIITDHHAIPAILPPAFAIIHPKIEGETYPDKGLSGGGVAFKLLQAVLRRHKQTHPVLGSGEAHESLEKWSLDMVAISSVADMVPLLGESRTLTKYGLIVLNKTRRIGLQKLLLEARITQENGTKKRTIDADTIGFQIAPRINAAGRMDHASVAYELLTTKDPEEAASLACALNDNNQERQKLVEHCVAEAVNQIERMDEKPPVLVAFHEEWPVGIVGLIASKLKEKFQKPALVVTKNNGNLMGSGRSIEEFNMIETLQEISECFAKFGGHPMACGFTFASEDHLKECTEKINQKFLEKTSGKDVSPTLSIDCELTLEDVTWELYDILEKFEPFGQGNPKPKYVAKGITVVGKEGVGQDEKHLRLMVRHTGNQTKKMMGWNLCTTKGTNWCQELTPGTFLDVVFEIGINEWNGNRELQMTIVDLKKSV